MLALTRFYLTTVGKKFVMAVTGIFLLGFVFVHMLGNLQLFVGSAKLNAYAAFLHGNPKLLWTFRVVMLAAVLWHVLIAVQLTLRNWANRPQKYKVVKYREADVSSRTMIYGGIFLVAFVFYHIAHLTLGSVGPVFDAQNVYGNVVAGFRVWWISAFYVVGMVCLGLHLYHGAWSLFQTLGLNHPLYNPLRRWLATGFAVLVAGANIAMPVAVLAGAVK
ncbi:MAG: succinate dehydrogenase cytochrome b subunit [Deltaproteobacteria bacterium]|nr:succinate dehydrogenase cytochrome b subunit [Deltaproteobacteria bacterium]